MIGYGAIEYPLSTFTYIVAKVGKDFGFADNKSFIIAMLVITRTLLILIEPYMYYLFLRLVVFFFRQHVNAVLKSNKVHSTTSTNLCLLKTWILSLTILKMLHSICIVTLNTVF
jgi:hypothetical protein